MSDDWKRRLVYDTGEHGRVRCDMWVGDELIAGPWCDTLVLAEAAVYKLYRGIYIVTSKEYAAKQATRRASDG